MNIDWRFFKAKCYLNKRAICLLIKTREIVVAEMIETRAMIAVAGQVVDD